MNIVVDRGEFLKTLKVAEKAISDNKIRPIISNMYLETVGNDKLILKGTDLELTITSEMECEVVEEGKIVFSYQLIEEYLKEISDKTVKLVVKDNLLVIETSDSASEFTVLDWEEYPKLSTELGGSFYRFSRDKIAEMFEKTKFAASASTDNLAINCVRMEIEDKKIKMAASDTYRLVYLEDEINSDVNMEVSIPLNTVEAIIKIARSLTEDEVLFSLEENQITFKIGSAFIQSRIIGLGFPNYKGIMGSVSYNKKISVGVDEIIKVLKRVQIFVKNNTESKYSAVFELKDGELHINGVSEIAKINDKIEVEQEGEGIRISLNVKFLLDFIQYLDKEKRLNIDLLSSNSAINLRNEGDNSYSYIAMPLALRD